MQSRASALAAQLMPTITSVRLSYTSEYLTLTARNLSPMSFIIIVPTYISSTFSLTENNALIDALAIVMPGTPLTLETFHHLIHSLQPKYRRVVDPVLVPGSECIAAIFASARPERPCDHPHRIVSVKLFLEDRNRVCIIARTAVGNILELELHVAQTNFQLSREEVTFLRYTFFFFRRGTPLLLLNFLSEAAVFDDTVPFSGYIVSGQNNHVHTLSFGPYTRRASAPFPVEVQRAVAGILTPHTPWFFPPERLEGFFRSPHRLVVFGGSIREDPDGIIFSGLFRNFPCAVRVINDENGLSTRLSTTAKQLLLLETHPNVVGVLDVFTQPRPALLMEDMSGPTLTDVVRPLQGGGPSMQREIGRYALEVARGMAFLHSRNFVHHHLRLSTVYVVNGTCRVACLDFGSQDVQMTTELKNGNEESRPDLEEIEILFQDGVVEHLSAQVEAVLFNVEEELTEESMGHNARLLPTKSFADRIDVACFGALLWESLSGNAILVNENTKMTEQKLEETIFQKMDMLLMLVEDSSGTLKSIIEQCWQLEPSQRPTMTAIVRDLEDWLNETENEPTPDSGESLPRFVDAGPGFRGVSTGNLTRRPRVKLRDRHGQLYDATDTYNEKYPDCPGSLLVSTELYNFLSWRDCYNLMNCLELISSRCMRYIPAYIRVAPGINQMRRREAREVMGADVLDELEKGFSVQVDSNSVQDIFEALTTPFRGTRDNLEKTRSTAPHLRLALSYRHVHPDERNRLCWPHRQRMYEKDYEAIAHRIATYARKVGAKTVSIWTDQHFAATRSSDAWGNNCLLPYIIYPVLYFEGGERNEDRLWICAEHQLAVSGEGIVAEVDELPGVWRKSAPGAVAGKLLPLGRGIVEAASALLNDIDGKQTYHTSDREDIMSWTRAIAYFGFSKRLWAEYNELARTQISSELAAAILRQTYSPTWKYVCHSRRWADGAVLRTSDGWVQNVADGERGWHGLMSWIRKEFEPDASELFSTTHIERITRATEVHSDDGRAYGFAFLIARFGQICRCCVACFAPGLGQAKVVRVINISELNFTTHLESLEAIACLKEDDLRRETEGMTSLLDADSSSIIFPSEREGQPSLIAVNAVLEEVGEEKIDALVEHKFLDGHEIQWT